ncbi:hypothetical protein BU17DRAFT_70342 [Hysterangium stoloniferum]|nr:hypothetical protein BU17DRAFT_70342 [Hysterangium stoloniferum]
MSQEMAELVVQVSDDRSFNHVITASIGQSGAWFWYTLNEISAALFTYDTLLTLSHEVEHIWKPRPFFSDTISTTSHLGHDFIFATGEHIYHGFLMARAYAISNKNILLILILLPLVLASTGLEVFQATLDTCQSTFATEKRITFSYHSKYDRSVLRDDYISDNHVVHVINDQFEKKSILFLTVYQARHSFVLTVSVTGAVTFKTLRFSLQGIIGPVHNFLSTIILCRFQLDLRERHVRRDDCTLDQVALGTFKAATRRVHEAVVDEFGDTELIDSLQMRQR